MINKQRLHDEFVKLISIDSLSKKEGQLIEYLTDKLKKLGACVQLDKAGDKIGGQTGNLIAHFKGAGDSRIPLMLNAHLDTVAPGENIKPIYKNGKFYTNKKTILGADDKSGIAIILEALLTIKEQNIPIGKLGIVFTAAEEIGLLGAKNLDYSKLDYKYCLAYDGMAADSIINQAPAANSIKFKVHGLKAHAGVNPEKGINAILLAACAIAGMKLGRIDHETTANIGTIKGGSAANIVPDYVELAGEARSHNPAKLERQTEHMRQAFTSAVNNFKSSAGLPSVEEDIRPEYPLMNVAVDSPLITLVKQAAEALGQKIELSACGGGSDANIFNGVGIETIIMGTGMQNPHSTNEFILSNDMEKSANLLVEIIKVNSLKANTVDLK